MCTVFDSNDIDENQDLQNKEENETIKNKENSSLINISSISNSIFHSLNSNNNDLALKNSSKEFTFIEERDNQEELKKIVEKVKIEYNASESKKNKEASQKERFTFTDFL